MNRQGILIVVSGFSGAGKGTIMKALTERYEGYALSVSATTRSPRPGEEDGKAYFFKSVEEFEQMIEDGALIEYARYVDNYYGTPKQYVDKLLEEGKNVFLEIEVNGAMQAMKLYKGLPMVSIFLIPPSFEELEYRIRHRRSEPEEVIHERLSKAHREINLKDNYVLNDSVERAADEIKTIIKNRLKKLEETGK